jgi:hypothetical protein
MPMYRGGNSLNNIGGPMHCPPQKQLMKKYK